MSQLHTPPVELDLPPSRSGSDLQHADDIYGKLWALANNLWWSWQPECDQLFRDIDPIRWRQLGHNPIALLREMTPERLADRAGELVLHSRINYAYRRLQEYLTSTQTWAATNSGVLGAKPVAYFSAEFGIHESVPIYSGGLGVLAGDHIKSASGLGVPLVGVGLYYSQGYFRQYLDDDGYQGEDYLETKIENLPMQDALDADGNPLTVSIDTRTGELLAKVWLMKVGRVRLYLLDCNIDGNKPEDRELTSRLYGGDERTRIRQELVLGVGGVKALAALGIDPGVYHLNEGHSAFGALQVVKQLMENDGMTFDDAVQQAARATCFTTHTPVPAGHDRFPPELVEEHLGPLRDSLGISEEELMALGRVDPDDVEETFCMTVIGFKMSRCANAVSNLHGIVSRRMWHSMWPDRPTNEVPIGHITNGVHVFSWLAVQMQKLYDKHFETDWKQRIQEPEAWQSIHAVDPGELWETHNALKNHLLSFVRRRISRQCRRRGEDDAVVEAARRMLDPRILTIGFGRRFATYKRANLLFGDLDRIAEIVSNADRPVQLIYAGKAHPKDEPGKRFIREIANMRHDPRFAGRVAFIEDYDINVCRHLIQGVDVWLNNPRRPLEASGTSGQKVVLNGGLNCSILDGWWGEAYNGVNGFAIGHGRSHVSDEITDRRDAEALYDTLENEVIPCFYDRDLDGLPKDWIKRMMHSISTLAWRFSSHRMVADYTSKSYVWAAGGVTCDMRYR
ncbi:glycosyltransferase family 1 protein [Roseiconus nitratireducens]|uniref:Glycosyltransferase family 1 protein n=1 Tax=Roseiconus nitratireducens TaxID=2605748 RepID=A0A5M6DIM3_9BACT|nr:alpha-glucan family phosphorylase [Roseiconus nitratireducens]KAA5546226.1 glycosyltransferase family 1 protein [Roseiconus nitratireducens]